jgi:hypothetical protein
MSAARKFKLTAFIPPEDDLAFSVCQALRGLLPQDAIFVAFDLSNARSAIEGARKKRLGCVAGFPDCSVWWRGKLVLIELKRERGGVLSPKQRELHAKLEAAEFPVCVCRSVPEVLEVVAAAGIPVRGRVA